LLLLLLLLLLLVVVVVDEPQGDNAYGSTVAVPVAKQIIDGLLVLEQIPPQVAVNAAPG
jgi:cell division protein FtsI (penicillin-binding protein 3)